MELKLKRGNIVLINLDPTIGHEQGKTRPALILQNNIGNKYSSTTIIAPITSKQFSEEFPTNVYISKSESTLNENSTILLNQIRTIDKSRIIKTISSLNSSIMSNVNTAIKISLDL